MRILITAGPTREPIDAVRFISNPSSGKMGFACARAARKDGLDVTLVTGPVPLADPRGVDTVRVTTAEEMRRALLRAFPRADAVIMTAAVGDYRPAGPLPGKLKKTSRRLTLHLVRTRDILGELGARKGRKVLVGFALEVQKGREHALEKYRRKNLDLIVLNSPRTFAADRMTAAVYREGKVIRRFRNAAKDAVAAWLVREAVSLAARHP